MIVVKLQMLLLKVVKKVAVCSLDADPMISGGSPLKKWECSQWKLAFVVDNQPTAKTV